MPVEGVAGGSLVLPADWTDRRGPPVTGEVPGVGFDASHTYKELLGAAEEGAVGKHVHTGGRQRPGVALPRPSQ